jgi:hypothetical protein
MRKDPPAPRHSRARGGTLQEGRRARRTTLLVTGLVAGAVLTGCSADADVREAAATGSPSHPPSAQPAAATSAGTDTDLAAGLLPAEAFGADARVLPVSGEQLSRGAPAGMGTSADVEVTPESCSAALQALPVHQPPAAEDLAAQVAVQGTTYTAELLALAGRQRSSSAGCPGWSTGARR